MNEPKGNLSKKLSFTVISNKDKPKAPEISRSKTPTKTRPEPEKEKEKEKKEGNDGGFFRSLLGKKKDKDKKQERSRTTDLLPQKSSQKASAPPPDSPRSPVGDEALNKKRNGLPSSDKEKPKPSDKDKPKEREKSKSKEPIKKEKTESEKKSKRTGSHVERKKEEKPKEPTKKTSKEAPISSTSLDKLQNGAAARKSVEQLKYHALQFWVQHPHLIADAISSPRNSEANHVERIFGVLSAGDLSDDEKVKRLKSLGFCAFQGILEKKGKKKSSLPKEVTVRVEDPDGLETFNHIAIVEKQKLFKKDSDPGHLKKAKEKEKSGSSQRPSSSSSSSKKKTS